MYSQYTNSLSKTSTPATECKHKLGTDHLSSRGGYVFFQKKYWWREKKSDSEFLSYILMLNSGKKILFQKYLLPLQNANTSYVITNQK